MPPQQVSGAISGTVVDESGAAVEGASVVLEREDRSPNEEVLTNAEGQFSFANVAAGNFQLSISSPGFVAQVLPGSLHAGEAVVLQPVKLAVAASATAMQVVARQSEVAEDEIKAQEKQRLLGFVPNFYVSYVRNAAPLDAKQKFELAWKATIDPINFALTGIVAGLEQAQNTFAGYGQGAEGYGKRFGASYADTFTGTFIGGAILPSLFKQDPRYFYSGQGGVRHRVLYAIAMSVICRGDNRHWQLNYSGLLGNLAAGGISNLYYPASDRAGVALSFETGAIGIGETAVANILQEFVVRKLTPNLPSRDPANP